MKSVACLAACAAIMSISVGASAGEITIRQFASSAPNAAGSSSWAGYVANAMNSLQNSPGTPEGSAEQPTYYSTLGNTFTAADAMVTSFHSWKGQADPAAPFANELGNRIHFGVIITETGGTFALADVSFKFHSSDVAGNFSDSYVCASGAGGSLCWENNLAGTSFSSMRIGISYGTDGEKGTGDDLTCDASSPCDDQTQLNELYYVGDGNAEWPGGPGDSLDGRAALDEWTNYINDNIALISNEYCVQGTCNTVTLRNAVPEPSSVALLMGSLGLLGFAARRKRRSTLAPAD